MYICLCKGITDSMVTGLEQQSLGPDEIISRLGIDCEDCCGKCASKLTSRFNVRQDAGVMARCR